LLNNTSSFIYAGRCLCYISYIMFIDVKHNIVETFFCALPISLAADRWYSSFLHQ